MPNLFYDLPEVLQRKAELMRPTFAPALEMYTRKTYFHACLLHETRSLPSEQQQDFADRGCMAALIRYNPYRNRMALQVNYFADLPRLKKPQLVQLAKENGLKRLSRLNKSQLISAILKIE